MSEFMSLVESAGYVPSKTVYIRRFTSKGLSKDKINEVREAIENTGAKTIIFDVELKPKHMYQIAKELRVTVKDRIEIILEIFKKHSPSKEADLQIKLASLQYELARARERVMLVKMGEQPPLTMGPGQYEVDKYYLEIKRRIQNIKKKLDEIRKKRHVHRFMRRKKGYKTITIVGYTCSGKTTLFNALTNLNMKVGAEPFTTLSTKYSLLKIGLWKVYLIDTIGFIRDLPPFVINAFYSTLEDIKYSDLVYLVVDVTEFFNSIEEKLRTSLEILEDLGYRGDIIIVGNKIDQINNFEALKPVKDLFENYHMEYVFISAHTGMGINELIKKTEDLLGHGTYIEIIIPYSNLSLYKILNLLKEDGKGYFYYIDDGVLFKGVVKDEILKSIFKDGEIRVKKIERCVDIEAES